MSIITCAGAIEFAPSAIINADIRHIISFPIVYLPGAILPHCTYSIRLLSVNRQRDVLVVAVLVLLAGLLAVGLGALLGAVL
jgi:hypothetical protein